MHNTHVPVLLRQALSYLAVTYGNWYIDATLGGGGYTSEILTLGGKVLGIDTDNETLSVTRQVLHERFPNKQEGLNWIVVHDNFRNIRHVHEKYEQYVIHGVVFDLGFSSIQIDDTTRGLSYRFPEVRMDFRLDRTQGVSTDVFLSQITQEDLEEILSVYGEEAKASEISKAMIKARQIDKLTTVGDLQSVVSTIVPSNKVNETLGRVCQSIRIAQNDELSSLKIALVEALELLPTGGRLVVVSFHSLEDRIVKRIFSNESVKELTKKPIIADERERMENPRSRSAKLRAYEKR